MAPRRRHRRWVLGSLLLTTVVLCAAGIAAWWVTGRAVPPLGGEVAVAGLQAPVEVLFDGWGVPHVYAQGREDAWFAAGYLHARDRLWQMELYRRAAAGRLSEVFGERTLAADRQFRAIALRRAATLEWAAASPSVTLALERYAAGVNAWTSGRGRWSLPVELQLLGVRPEPWSPVDSLSIGKLMAWRLAENRHGELVRGALARRFGLADANRLMGGLPAHAPTIMDTAETTAKPQPPAPAAPASGAARRATGGDTRAAAQPLPAGLEWLGLASRPGASNSWVVSGARTASGRPLLANDPHLDLEMPALWYELHLAAAELEVAGATIPGTPFVVIGHNASLAWGLTNTGADVQDFYVEDVDFPRRRYRFRDGWLPLEVDRVEIGVRGRAAPDVFEIFRTRHGPLVATEASWGQVPDFSTHDGRRYPRPLALRWEAVAQYEAAGAFEALNRAQTWDAFLEAVRRFGAPSQNFVYADVAGNIGYAMSGALPIRPQGDGSVPVPGWTGAHDWVGTVPTSRLPARVNPPAGQFVTANAEIDRRWPGVMTRDWSAHHRTARIVQMLGDRTGLDAQAFRAMQADARSGGAELLLQAVEHASRSRAMDRAEPEARTAIERLRLWDRVADGRPVVSLFQAFERAFWRRTFADEMDAPLFEQLFEYGLSERHVGLHAIVTDPASHWWDDIATIDRRETRDDIVVLAAADAFRHLRTKFGDETNWRWDRLHAAHFDHPLGAGGWPLAWFFNRGPIPVAGETTTVQRTGIDPRRPYGVREVSSYRQVVSPGAWDETLASITTGQSGHPRSPHYFDQNALWAGVTHRTVPFSRAAVEQARTSRLLLVPAAAPRGGR
jgi:penicillin G amidase